MNDILIFLTGMIVYLITNIHKQNNKYRHVRFVKGKLEYLTKTKEYYEKESKMIRKISFMPILLSFVIILTANILHFSDRGYLISGAMLILLPIVFMKISKNIKFF
ncbi:hypothetical protein [Paraclostridium sordellii]|uniref:Membrane protein n=1 Tax=Paraclostridium sordellii TaxID=1505 RepID=A0A9P1L394_PARSO|nr:MULTISPECIES: hypothetical protein [Paeniclostridium]EPZ58724.1 putative membrane protein [[Clostridium] sordellii ATCC 9714] [Paeniclostridium sordellii ATCC 9714]MBS6023527.1 hypothetical protein [Paeniclostridium sordellii]MBW4862869.1 hypothetical protein [Paeniclostridium sp.]MCQ4696111.1 hypothetical protein [Paeniclostridium sordellii]MDU2686330.1 hypothetical protein [Paeniclostridium sordellii]